LAFLRVSLFCNISSLVVTALDEFIVFSELSEKLNIKYLGTLAQIKKVTEHEYSFTGNGRSKTAATAAATTTTTLTPRFPIAPNEQYFSIHRTETFGPELLAASRKSDVRISAGQKPDFRFESKIVAGNARRIADGTVSNGGGDDDDKHRRKWNAAEKISSETGEV
jgi:hypothetical protein